MAKLKKGVTSRAASSQQHKPHSLSANQVWMHSDAKFEAMVEALDPEVKHRVPPPVTIRKFSWEK